MSRARSKWWPTRTASSGQRTVKTAQAPARLKLKPDRNEIRCGRPRSVLRHRAGRDKAGSLAPRADNRIHFTIEGPGEIVATDNGDPTSFEPFNRPTAKPSTAFAW